MEMLLMVVVFIYVCVAINTHNQEKVQKRFNRKLYEIHKRLNKIENPKRSIGEVLVTDLGLKYTPVTSGEKAFLNDSFDSRMRLKWVKFYKVQDRVDDKIKIHGMWHENTNVLFYRNVKQKNDPVLKEKRRIEKIL